MKNAALRRSDKTRRMVQLALLAAVEIILTLVYIPVGTINLNFGLVPIVIAGIFLTPLDGALIGAVSGAVTMIQVLTSQSIIYTFLVAANPVAACLLCLVKTAAAGYVAGLLFRLVYRASKNHFAGTITAALLCPAVNTGVFALGMLTVFGRQLMADPVISTWTNGGLFALVFVVLIGANFFVEEALSLVVSPVLARALRASHFFDRKN